MKPILYIQVVGCEGPGLIDQELPPQHPRMICRPSLGQPIPQDPGKFEAIVVLGGPMGVYEADKYPWIHDCLELLQRSLVEDLPVLGICLGSQLLAAAAGAKVSPSGIQEIGWEPVVLTQQGRKDPLTCILPDFFHAFHWHGDRWDLPEGAQLLAYSRKCDHQAFRIGTLAYGFQFHLEVPPESPLIWAEAYQQSLLEIPGAPSPSEIYTGTNIHAAQTNQLGRQLFSLFWHKVFNHHPGNNRKSF